MGRISTNLSLKLRYVPSPTKITSKRFEKSRVLNVEDSISLIFSKDILFSNFAIARAK